MSRNPKTLTGNVAIVGGSLAGLAVAIGLARCGISVTVFEQTSGDERGGSGLGVDRALISATTGVDARVDGLTHALPVVDEGYRETSTWYAIFRWLRAVADATEGLTVHETSRVDLVDSRGDRVQVSGPSVEASADVAIGADGYRSVVRRAVSPLKPFAPYGGFLIWRALVQESWLPSSLVRQLSLGGGRTSHPDAARLVVYRVPGPDGQTAPGERSITVAWYDASRTVWLRNQGYLVGDEVMGSVPSAAIDAELRDQLLATVARRWRGAAREILTTAIHRQVLFGTPLAEYLPNRLVHGRVGIVGDAAHVASPMVGAGFSSGLEDGAAFRDAVVRSGGTDGDAGHRALRLYSEMRLEPNRERVLESLSATQDLLQSVQPS
jgi:2-polyprenyl-6-methoxyphenol hydroxylase-like FAD-dependent oxidoreductase